ncbi:hypothetical protein [Actinocatenispora sera]|uniref:Uncharacterized protein n=1 Tax=Actinocatenispora sera TaxID=390989 RepID=A0A810KW20_9ACTN|nr:hypothetical protein [Actinocatenispora sera]BCJ26481.1 hypothetical protein Asera_05890 [Actinocatenispora sera]
MRRVLGFVTSRYGLAGLVALLIIVIVVVGRVAGVVGGGSGHDDAAVPVTGGTQAGAGTTESGAPNDGPTGAPPTPSPVVPAGKAGPVTVATSFSTAYLDSNGPAKTWRAALRRYATDKLASELGTMDPATVPAQRRTGAAKLGDHGAHWAQVAVPCDSGTLTLRLLGDGDGWLVDGIDWAPAS